MCSGGWSTEYGRHDKVLRDRTGDRADEQNPPGGCRVRRRHTLVPRRRGRQSRRVHRLTSAADLNEECRNVGTEKFSRPDRVGPWHRCPRRRLPASARSGPRRDAGGPSGLAGRTWRVQSISRLHSPDGIPPCLAPAARPRGDRDPSSGPGRKPGELLARPWTAPRSRCARRCRRIPGQPTRPRSR